MDIYGKRIESVNNDIADIEDRIGDASPRVTLPKPRHRTTEHLPILGEDALADHVSASDRRAVALFEHWNEWSTKPPRGKLLKTADSLRTLLSTVCDEHLKWKQVYRVCRRVEQLSKGAITFFQHDKHGWMLKQHSAFASKQATNAELV